MKPTLLSFLFSISFNVAFSQGCHPDVTFGTNGIVNTTIGSISVIHCMAIQGDGKIVAAGYTTDYNTSSFALTRYNPNGSLDASFNGTGKTEVIFGFQAEANCMAIQQDGKIVAAGFSYNGDSWEFAVVRLRSDGSPDSSFDGDGKLTTSIGNIDDEINSIAIQDDGKIIVAGYSNSSEDLNYFEPEIAVARYNINGSLDTSFNGSGIITSSLGYYDVAHSMTIQADGRIVIGGTHINGSNYEFLLCRFNMDGSPDSTFNGDGHLSYSSGSWYNVINSVVMQPDGKIVASGISANGNVYDFNVARYNCNGTSDTAFGQDGQLITPIEDFFDVPTSMALQSDGKVLLAAGFSNNSNNRDLILIRYNSNGSLDTSFGINGKIITNIAGNDFIYSVQLAGSRIYIGGSNQHFLLAAYLNNANTLPLHLLSFSAGLQDHVANLQWQTTGTDHSLFKIERSTDGTHFIAIGEKTSISNIQQYLFQDENPVQGINFYRLQLVDQDGRSSYSNVVRITNNAENFIKVFPNPATDFLKLQVPVTQNKVILLQITDAGGKVISSESFVSPTSLLPRSLDVSHLQHGIYFLSVKCSSGMNILKFVKE